MSNAKPRSQKRKPARRVVRRLLAAVDKTLRAADEVREARDELNKLASKEAHP